MHKQKPILDHSGARFTAPLVHVGKGWWLVIEELTFSSGGVLEVRVPKYFLCDLASIPWFARWLLDRSGDGVYAAVIHDYLLERGITSRTLADAIFREALIASSVPAWKRILMFLGVRIGAVLPWKNEPPLDVVSRAKQITKERLKNEKNHNHNDRPPAWLGEL